MKIFHTAALLTPPVGILSQMEWEQEAAHQLGLDWKVRMFCPAGSAKEGEIIRFSENIKNRSGKGKLRKLINWVVLRWEYHRWLKSFEASVDIFLLRHYVHDPFQLLFIARCKKPVYLVHHELEGPELELAGGFSGKGGFAGKFRATLELLIGRYSIRQSKITIGVTREIIDYETKRALQPGKPSLLYPNGIMYSNQTVADKRTEMPELIFLASFFKPWHGLDLLLAAMQKNHDKFILHLVGDVSLGDKALAHQDKRVVLHGRKSHQEIQNIAAACWIGISSFGLFRQNMKEACTLKVREYLMMGLPVYAGYQDIFPTEFKFYKNGEIDIDKILQFAKIHRQEQRAAISSAARRYIDKVELVRGLFNECTNKRINS